MLLSADCNRYKHLPYKIPATIYIFLLFLFNFQSSFHCYLSAYVEILKPIYLLYFISIVIRTIIISWTLAIIRCDIIIE